jgi:hypothetical protein
VTSTDVILGRYKVAGSGPGAGSHLGSVVDAGPDAVRAAGRPGFSKDQIDP